MNLRWLSASRLSSTALVLTAWLMSAAVVAADTPVTRALGRVNADDNAGALLILEEALEDFPGDQDTRFLYARVLAWNGQRTASLAQFEQLLAENPDNADYLLASARVLYWQGRFDESLRQLEQARALAPEYLEVWDMQLRVLQARNQGQDKTEFTALLTQARSRWPAESWPQWIAAGQGGSRPPRGFVEAGMGYQDLSDQLPDWSSFYISGSRMLANDARLYGDLRQEDRFDQSDTQFRAGLDWPLRARAALTLEASIAPGAEVLPRWSLFSALQYPLAGGYGLSAGLRHASYADTSLSSLTLGGEKYFGEFRAAYTLYASKLDGADLNFANQLRLDRYYRGESRVGLLVSAGRETESVGQGQFIENDTVSVVATGLHQLGPVWSISWDVIFHDRIEAYSRGGFRVGFRRNF